MTDVGNTANQVSPIIKESEVDMFRDFFNRLANTVVQASDFAAQVSNLRVELDQIRAEAAEVRRRNMELDEELAYVREQRNKAQEEARQNAERAAQMEKEREEHRTRADMAEADSHSLQSALDTARRERDEAQFRVLELTEAKEKAEALLNDLRAKLGIPVPPADLPPLTQTAPKSMTELVPPPEPERVYVEPGHPDFHLTTAFDHDMGMWYYTR